MKFSPFLTVTTAGVLAPVSQAPPRPNIVMIYADDLGFGDLSCYGMTRLQTPNCDRLAREGLRFTDAHSSSATCTPSRYSLLTGVYAWRKQGTGILPGDVGLIIDPAQATLPAVLRGAGYQTAAVGKWHLGLGGPDGPDWNGQITPGPNQVGFDSSFVMAATGDRVPTVYVENGRVVDLDPTDPIRVSYQEPFPGEITGENSPQQVRMKSNGPQHNKHLVNGVPRIGYMTGGKAALWKDEDMADTFTAKAIDFISRPRGKQPFSLYFAPHDVHVPRITNPRFQGASPMGSRGNAIAEFDDSVGRIMDALRRLRLDKNTLVILSSDNGPAVNDGYFDDSIVKLGDHRPASIYRDGKYSVHEGGTRIPLLTWWLGQIQPGTSAALVGQIDFLSSLASLTGAKPSPELDSSDHWSVFAGKDRAGRSTLVEQGSANSNLALRSGQWKLITGPKPELYDLSSDPSEKIDVAAQNPAQTQEMLVQLEAIRHPNPH